MKPEDILKTIDILPKLIIYFLPGYLLIKAIKYQLSYKHIENKSIYICYVVVSYILINVGEVISKLILGYSDVYSVEFSSGIIISSLISGYIVGQFLNSNKSTEILEKLNIYRTHGQNIFSDIKDVEKGTWVKVYLNNESIVYSGALREIEHSDNYDNTFILLSNYITYAYKNNELDTRLFVEERKDVNWVAIKIKDVSRIEIIYAEDSNKLKSR